MRTAVNNYGTRSCKGGSERIEVCVGCTKQTTVDVAAATSKGRSCALPGPRAAASNLVFHAAGCAKEQQLGMHFITVHDCVVIVHLHWDNSAQCTCPSCRLDLYSKHCRDS